MEILGKLQYIIMLLEENWEEGRGCLIPLRAVSFIIRHAIKVIKYSVAVSVLQSKLRIN